MPRRPRHGAALAAGDADGDVGAARHAEQVHAGDRDGALRARAVMLDRLGASADNSGIRIALEMEIQLLQSEAEAVILYDPVFPADPFAR